MNGTLLFTAIPHLGDRWFWGIRWYRHSKLAPRNCTPCHRFTLLRVCIDTGDLWDNVTVTLLHICGNVTFILIKYIIFCTRLKINNFFCVSHIGMRIGPNAMNINSGFIFSWLLYLFLFPPYLQYYLQILIFVERLRRILSDDVVAFA